MLALLIASFSLLPQEPVTPTPPAAAATATPARWLPDNALLALTIAPVRDDSALTNLLAQPEGSELTRQLRTLLQPALDQLRIPMTEFASALRGGSGCALVGLGASGPNVVFVADLGPLAAQVAERCATLPQRQGLATIGDGPWPVFVATEGTFACAGTHAATVSATLARAVGDDSPSLAEDRDHVESLAGNGAALAHLFVRLTELANVLVEQMPAAQRTIANRAIDALGIADLRTCSATWQLEGDQLVSRWQVTNPAAAGLLHALAGKPGSLDGGLARLVPEGATTFGFISADLDTVYDEVLAIAGAVQPAVLKGLEAQTDQLLTATGVDVRADLVGGLGDRIVTFALPDAGGVVAMIELPRAAAFARALGKLLADTPLRRSKVAGIEGWSADDGGPAFAVGGSWLVIADATAALAAGLHQLQRAEGDPRALALLESLPKDATSCMQAPVLPAGALSAWLGTAPAVGSTAARTLWVRRTADTLLAEERCDSRSALAAGTAALALLSGSNPGGTSATVPTDDGRAALLLRNAETTGKSRATMDTLIGLLRSPDAAVVARACWQLGEWQAQDAASLLAEVASTHATADVRLHATQALCRLGTPETLPPLSLATQDSDARVRQCAVAGLAALDPAAAAGPLLAMIDRLGTEAPTANGSDLVAAILQVHDLGDTQNLLPVATAIRFTHAQVGQALAFLFQGLSPKLAAADELTTLLAVLDHSEPLLRRYAIQRLGELRDPNAAAALEGRLVRESAELQPLVRVSLTQVRGDRTIGDDDLVTRAKSNVTAISQMVERRWGELGTTGQLLVAGAGSGLLLLVLGIFVARRRGRRSAAIAEARALVGPSAGYAASRRPFDASARSQETVGSGFGR